MTNIHSEVSKEHLKEIFGHFGKILNVDIYQSKKKGDNCDAYVQYKYREDVKMGKKMSNHIFSY